MDGKENKDLLTSTNFTFYFSDEMSSFIKKNLIQKKKKKKRKKKGSCKQTHSMNKQLQQLQTSLTSQRVCQP